VAAFVAASISFFSPAGAEGLAPGMKSESGAVLYSFAGTAVPVGVGVLAASSEGGGAAGGVLIVGGYLLGPSCGHFYAGRPGRALAGVGIRTVALVGLGAAIAVAWNENDNTGASVLGTASMVLGLTSVVVDMAGAAKSARIHNAKLTEKKFCVAPAAIGRARAPGLRADWRF